MLDARALPEVPASWLVRAKSWCDTPFAWKRWENYDPAVGGHEHCEFCWACICNHRELFPNEKEEHAKRGCYRHAFYARGEDGRHIWVCRSCFKRVAPVAGWVRSRTREGFGG